MNDTPKIDPKYPLPVGQAALPDSRAASYTGVIEQQMHATKGIVGDLRQGLDFVGLGYIGTHGQYLSTASLEFFFSLLEGALLDVSQHDLHPFLGTFFGQRTANAAGCSRDDSNFPLEILHVTPSLSNRKLYLPSIQ